MTHPICETATKPAHDHGMWAALRQLIRHWTEPSRRRHQVAGEIPLAPGERILQVRCTTGDQALAITTTAVHVYRSGWFRTPWSDVLRFRWDVPAQTVTLDVLTRTGLASRTLSGLTEETDIALIRELVTENLVLRRGADLPDGTPVHIEAHHRLYRQAPLWLALLHADGLSSAHAREVAELVRRTEHAELSVDDLDVAHRLRIAAVGHRAPPTAA